jgi:hypothetical protein
MATLLPTDGDMDRSVPHGEETGLILRGLASAPRPTNGLSGLQAALFRAIVHAKLGLDVDPNALEPVEPDEFGGRGPAATVLRSRLVQHVEVLTLMLQPLDQTAARRVETFAEEPCVGNERIHRLRVLAEGPLQLAAHGFDRNRYLNGLEIDSRLDGLRPSGSDPTPPTGRGQLGSPATASPPTGVPSASCRPTRSVAMSMTSTSCVGSRFRHAGFRATPAREHDCVHVLADYGSRDLALPPTSPETTAAGSVRPWHPDGMSPAPRAAASSGMVPTGTMSPRASGAGAMTAKPCDPTATAPEEGR